MCFQSFRSFITCSLICTTILTEEATDAKRGENRPAQISFINWNIKIYKSVCSLVVTGTGYPLGEAMFGSPDQLGQCLLANCHSPTTTTTPTTKQP